MGLYVIHEILTDVYEVHASNVFSMTEKNAKIANNKETIFVYPTDEFEVSKIPKNEKNKKNTGEDGMSNEMLKCCSPNIAPHIATLFNNCIKERIFPDCFKSANVIAFYKMGDHKDPEKYRPISLSKSLGETFEKVLHKRMMKFCESNNLLQLSRVSVKVSNLLRSCHYHCY